MVAPVLCVPLCTLLLSLVKTSLTYKISTVDSAGVCNETIWLEEGAKSAAILRLTAKDFYDFAPLHCQITFKAPKHTWSGLTGVLEEVDLRRYEDTTGHHLAQSECIDYFMVVSDSRVPQQRQCGSWSVSGHEQLTHLGYRRALVGYCPTPPANDLNVPRCGVTELTVEVSVGQRDSHYLWRDTRWRPHRGFTFVVTAYRYSYHESGCAAGFRSCGTTDHTHKHHCVHQSLWCDHHINCGQPHNYDEISCLDDEMLGGLVTVMVGPWLGAALLLLLVLGGVLYWRRSRPPAPREPLPPQELNSYAESYEVSSTLSSAHHMAIQVRVVCNPGHGTNNQRSHPWQSDLPPSYESLFPQGPPSPKPSTNTSTATTPATNSAASFDITATSLLSLGSAAAAYPVTSAYFSNTTQQTSSIVIPISAICNTLSTSGVSTTSCTTTNSFTTTPVFSNTSVTASTSFTDTPKLLTNMDSNSAGIPSTSAAMYATSREAPGTTCLHNETDNTHRLTPTTPDSTDYPHSPTGRAIATGTYSETGHITALQPLLSDLTPPLVEPEDMNITPSHVLHSTAAAAASETAEAATSVSCSPSGCEERKTYTERRHETLDRPWKQHPTSQACAAHANSQIYAMPSTSQECAAHASSHVTPAPPPAAEADTLSVGDEVPPGATGETEVLGDAILRPTIPVDTGQTDQPDTTSPMPSGGEESISTVTDNVSETILLVYSVNTSTTATSGGAGALSTAGAAAGSDAEATGVISVIALTDSEA